MSEIPEDIDRIATDIVREPFGPDEDAEYGLYLRIAKALLAERLASPRPPGSDEEQEPSSLMPVYRASER